MAPPLPGARRAADARQGADEEVVFRRALAADFSSSAAIRPRKLSSPCSNERRVCYAAGSFSSWSSSCSSTSTITLRHADLPLDS